MAISSLKNKYVLITAGPTREAIDPVRYISNHSSGKMGYALAESFLYKGAKVVLVSGPVNIHLQHPNLTIVSVVSAAEMYTASSLYFNDIDIAVFAAAVADYKPELVPENKIKKAGKELFIKLIENPDIAFGFGKVKRNKQISVGFALETDNEMEYAKDKLLKKSFDMIVLNSMNDVGATFEHNTNKITILKKDGSVHRFPVKHKTEVANDIVKEIEVAIVQQQTFIV